MTIQQMIDILTSIPDKQQRIVVNGYEGGLHDIEGFSQVNIKLNVHTSWYYGPHEPCFENDKVDESAYIINALPNPSD